MCVPCCESAAQYLDTEGNPKPEWIAQQFGESAVVSKEVDSETDWGKWVFKKHGHYPTDTIVTMLGTPLKLCTCPCHVEGSQVMH
ncbi:hypothetical protein D3C81_442510 [compost metagenome]